eukprot:scaffold95774_cov63-Phaeocystis_antarctica.AAC.1
MLCRRSCKAARSVSCVYHNQAVDRDQSRLNQGSRAEFWSNALWGKAKGDKTPRIYGFTALHDTLTHLLIHTHTDNCFSCPDSDKQTRAASHQRARHTQTKLPARSSKPAAAPPTTPPTTASKPADEDGDKGGGGGAASCLVGGVLTDSTMTAKAAEDKNVEADAGLESAVLKAGSAASAAASVWKLTVNATRTLAAVTVADTAASATPASPATFWRMAIRTASVTSETDAEMVTSIVTTNGAGAGDGSDSDGGGGDGGGDCGDGKEGGLGGSGEGGGGEGGSGEGSGGDGGVDGSGGDGGNEGGGCDGDGGGGDGGGEGDGGGGDGGGGDGGGGHGDGGDVGGGGEGGGELTTHEPSSELARLSKLLAPGAMQPLVTYMQSLLAATLASDAKFLAPATMQPSTRVTHPMLKVATESKLSASALVQPYTDAALKHSGSRVEVDRGCVSAPIDGEGAAVVVYVRNRQIVGRPGISATRRVVDTLRAARGAGPVVVRRRVPAVVRAAELPAAVGSARAIAKARHIEGGGGV